MSREGGTGRILMEEMSFYSLFGRLHAYKTELYWYMLALPFFAWGVGSILKRISPRVANCFLAFPVFLAVLPGICTAVALGYLIFIVRVNILEEVDLILYGGSILCMIATLYAISRVSRFDDIPGFDRLSGLMVLAGLSFALTLFVAKLRFLVGFFASLTTLFFLFIIIFAFFMFGMTKIKGRK